MYTDDVARLDNISRSVADLVSNSRLLDQAKAQSAVLAATFGTLQYQPLTASVQAAAKALREASRFPAEAEQAVTLARQYADNLPQHRAGLEFAWNQHGQSCAEIARSSALVSIAEKWVPTDLAKVASQLEPTLASAAAMCSRPALRDNLLPDRSLIDSVVHNIALSRQQYSDIEWHRIGKWADAGDHLTSPQRENINGRIHALARLKTATRRRKINMHLGNATALITLDSKKLTATITRCNLEFSAGRSIRFLWDRFGKLAFPGMKARHKRSPPPPRPLSLIPQASPNAPAFAA